MHKGNDSTPLHFDNGGPIITPKGEVGTQYSKAVRCVSPSLLKSGWVANSPALPQDFVCYFNEARFVNQGVDSTVTDGGPASDRHLNILP